MRITYRYTENKEYWERRWSNIEVDQPMSNYKVYPLKYAEMCILDKNGPILEAGCGTGRILMYYHNKNYDIIGIDFIKDAINKIKRSYPEVKAEYGDIKKLQFKNNTFKYVLAFGLYHNLENGIKEAINETRRVLMPGGRICASFRADNIQTRLVDWLDNRKARKVNKAKTKVFHKINYSQKEFLSLMKSNGFHVLDIFAVENMPLLYKFSFFRSKNHKKMNENIAREQGYKLSTFGYILQKFIMKIFPNQFCNLYVIIAQKKDY